MITVKICGITNEKDLKAAAESGADFLGFVVDVPSSPRNLSITRAKELIRKVPENVSSVSVTIFQNIQRLERLYSDLNPQYLQVHGNLNHLLKSSTDLTSKELIIGAVDATTVNSLKIIEHYARVFNSILLDTANPSGGGGTGVTHDWSLSKKIRDRIYPTPLILAGGLTPRNVEKAIREVRPSGVDVASGVERYPGIKDHTKIVDFIVTAKEVRF